MVTTTDYCNKWWYKEDKDWYIDTNCWSKKQFYIIDKYYDYVWDFSKNIFIEKVSIKSIWVIAPNTYVFQIDWKYWKKYSWTKKDYEIFNSYDEALESDDYKEFKKNYVKKQKEMYITELKNTKDIINQKKNRVEEIKKIISKLWK